MKSHSIFYTYVSLSSNNIFLLFYLFFFLCPSVSAANNDMQQLLSFKSLLSDPTQLPNWSKTNNLCDFTGVTCNTNSTVVSIDLSTQNLQLDFLKVSSFLLTLPNLKTLLLRNSSITGKLSVFARFQCSLVLEKLDLAENSISGPISNFFSLSSCIKLKFLNLSGNLLEYSASDSKGLSFNLESLDLSYNKIIGPKFVPWLLSRGCSELVHLSLKGNKVAGSVVHVQDCKNLEFLDLSSNNFSTGVPKFDDFLELNYLDLSSNKFYGDISDSISTCKKLTFLNITLNQFGDGVVPFLPSGNLKFLYLSANGFQGHLPNHLSDLCSSLVELDVSFNSLSGYIPESFGACYSLELFDISRNNFSGKLPIDTLLKMTSLKNMLFGFNSFVGELSESFGKMTTLETLDVSSNLLNGSVPAGICQDPRNSLKVLYLQNNEFTGSIPDALGNCSKLESLDLSFNYLDGTIPSSLGSLSNLRDLILWLNQLHGVIPEELTHIKTLKNLILDFNDLTGSIPSSLSNCTSLNWISMSNNQLSGEIPASFGQLTNLAILKLGNNSLTGSIPSELGDCRSLIWIDLNTNLLNGTIPPALFKQSGNIVAELLAEKPYGYIKNDGSKECHGAGNLLEFGGIRQEKLNRTLTRHPCNFTRVYWGNTEPTFNNNGSIIFLDLSYNKLEGCLPKELGSMYYAQILNLGHNGLSGPIPQELGKMRYTAILDLSYNQLNGSIPQTLTGLSILTDIDLSNNHLSGMIPESAPLDTFPKYRFLNNTGLCGYPLPHCGSGASTKSGDQNKKSSRRKASLAGSVAMGLLFSLFCIFGLILIAVETRKRKEASLEAYIESHSHSGSANSGWKLTSAREALSISLATFDNRLRKLTFADLLEATNGFHNDTLVGSGGFGDVYRARLKDGSIVAIKKLVHVSGQGDREFTAEMETIGKVKHRNLVPLLGYCEVGDERLLVYEYMKFGSLADVLHDRKKIGINLNWAARRKIAIGMARGLAFLHHNCDPHIIHRDMKSSNVLLDENLEARVSDFGMARKMNVMDTHLSVSMLAGTPGYVPPEYYQSFKCTTKGDVYSYGVILLELLTGRHPTDSLDFGDTNLVGWVRQQRKLKISQVFDPLLLKEDPSSESELSEHLEIACLCSDDRPWKRPIMIQVIAMIKEIQAGSCFDSLSTVGADDVQVIAMFKEIQAGSGFDSLSTVGADDVHFAAVGVEMSIKDVEMRNHG